MKDRKFPRLHSRDYLLGLQAFAVCVAIGAAVIYGPSLLPSAPSQPLAVASERAPSVRLRIIDGDTYEVMETGERIRQENIDTPETGGRERCPEEREAGERATAEARRLIHEAEYVSVRRSGRTDRYGRTIGWVSVDGRDIGDVLIERGVARPWRGRREPWC